MYPYSSVYMVEKISQSEINNRLLEAENDRLVALVRKAARGTQKVSERSGLPFLRPMASWLLQMLRG